MVAVLGIHRPVNSWDWTIIICIPLLRKSIIERTTQYIKDRTESFDDYFPCRKNKCRLDHVMRWMNLFIDMHDEMILQRTVK